MSPSPKFQSILPYGQQFICLLTAILRHWHWITPNDIEYYKVKGIPSILSNITLESQISFSFTPQTNHFRVTCHFETLVHGMTLLEIALNIRWSEVSLTWSIAPSPKLLYSDFFFFLELWVILRQVHQMSPIWL